MEEDASARQHGLEANPQSFPLNSAGGGGREYQTLIPLDLVGKEIQFGNRMQYFNWDLHRIIWISTTLIFVIASLANCATYLMSKKTDPSVSWSFYLRCFPAVVMAVYGFGTILVLVVCLLVTCCNSKVGLILFFDMWRYSHFLFIPTSLLIVIPMSKKGDSWIFDFRCFQALKMAVFGYGGIGPIGFCFALKYLDSKVGRIHPFHMWIYSLFISIPSSVLLFIQVGILQWSVTLVAGVASATFFGLNLKSRVLAIVLVFACVLQFVLAMFIKSFSAVEILVEL